MLRVTLLLAGFRVGVGHATGEKEETTIASNAPELVAEPLGREWLKRALASTSAEPMHEPAKPAPAPRKSKVMRDPLLTDLDRGIRVGDTKLVVRAILGPPVIGNDEVWEYGPSHVTFKNGVVTGWFNSPLKPIRVDED